MSSPPLANNAPAVRVATRLKNLFKSFSRSKNKLDSLDGSSRRGRRYLEGDERSYGKESSTRSTMFDLELSHRGNHLVGKEAAGPEQSGDVGRTLSRPAFERVRYLARPVASFEVDLLQDVQALCGSLLDANGSMPLSVLASDLASMGYNCSIQCVESPGLAEASNYGPEAEDTRCLELLRHEFLICNGRLDGTSDHQCLIDPQFRDQFLLGKYNEEYEHLLKIVPQAFVGSPLRLQALASVICAEMANVYLSLGISLPPWRKPHAVLGKWFDTASSGSRAAGQGMQGQITKNSSVRKKNEQKKKSSNFFSMLTMHKEYLKKQGNNEAQIEKSNKPHRRLDSSQRSSPGSSTVSSGSAASLANSGPPQVGVSLLARSLQNARLGKTYEKESKNDTN